MRNTTPAQHNRMWHNTTHQCCADFYRLTRLVNLGCTTPEQGAKSLYTPLPRDLHINSPSARHSTIAQNYCALGEIAQGHIFTQKCELNEELLIR